VQDSGTAFDQEGQPFLVDVEGDPTGLGNSAEIVGDDHRRHVASRFVEDLSPNKGRLAVHKLIDGIARRVGDGKIGLDHRAVGIGRAGSVEGDGFADVILAGQAGGGQRAGRRTVDDDCRLAGLVEATPVPLIARPLKV